MKRSEAQRMIVDVASRFFREVEGTDVELSISYEHMPQQFDVDPVELAENPFEAPHSYRIAMRRRGDLVFDGFFSDPIKAIDTMVSGIKAGIADETWPSWMATLDPTWAPS
jgi:hypothetical protein